MNRGLYRQACAIASSSVSSTMQSIMMGKVSAEVSRPASAAATVQARSVSACRWMSPIVLHSGGNPSRAMSPALSGLPMAP